MGRFGHAAGGGAHSTAAALCSAATTLCSLLRRSRGRAEAAPALSRASAEGSLGAARRAGHAAVPGGMPGRAPRRRAPPSRAERQRPRPRGPRRRADAEPSASADQRGRPGVSVGAGVRNGVAAGALQRAGTAAASTRVAARRGLALSAPPGPFRWRALHFPPSCSARSARSGRARYRWKLPTAREQSCGGAWRARRRQLGHGGSLRGTHLDITGAGARCNAGEITKM